MTSSKKNAILVTAFGSFSAECVVSSLQAQGTFNIIGCDIYPAEWHAVSSKFYATYQVPLVKDEEKYLNKILNICCIHNVKYIMPLTDVEVDFFSKNKQTFAQKDVIICVTSEAGLKIARNKFESFKFFKEDNNIPTVESYLLEEVTSISFLNNYPYVVKPCDGRSSEGVAIIQTPLELEAYLLKRNYIIQPIINGPIFTVDYVRSAHTGNSFSVARKELLRTKNGAGISVEIKENSILSFLTNYIGEKLNINGCINMEFIESDDQYYLIDINPRFSAGVAFSILAGYDMVYSHLCCFTDKDILPDIKVKKMIAVKKMVEIITTK